MTPQEVILWIVSKGYSVTQTTCALCVITRGGKIIVKVKKGFSTEEAKYAALLKAFKKKRLDGST